MRRRLGGADGVRVVTTGMGPAAAARAAAVELRGPVDAVVVAGVGGGCDPGLAVGTVVVASALCDLDGGALDAPVACRPARLAALAAGGPAVSGVVASGATVVDDDAGRARLAAAGALVVETEAAGWAPECRRAGVPLLVVRAVLDTPARPLGAAAGLVPPGGRGPSALRLLGLARHPATWGSLPHLARAASLAEGRAAAAAAAAVTVLLSEG